MAGIIGTAVMSMVIFIAPMMGMPKMSPPAMLAAMMGMPLIAGWVMHFIIGSIFSLAYTYLFAPGIRIGNLFLKGGIFGFVVFIFGQIMMAVLGTMLPLPKMEGSMILTMAGSIMGHVIYGIAVSKVIKFKNHGLYKQQLQKDYTKIQTYFL